MGYRMNWDPKSYEGQGGGDRNESFDIHTMELPKWVRVRIIRAEMESTKAQDGLMAALGMKIVSDGDEANFAFWPRYMVEHDRAEELENMATAVAIGRQSLADIRDACELGSEDDVEDLVGAELDVKVDLEKGKRRKDGDGHYPDKLRPVKVDMAGSHSVCAASQADREKAARDAGSPFYPESRSQTPAPTGAELSGRRPDPTTVKDPDDDIDF